MKSSVKSAEIFSRIVIKKTPVAINQLPNGDFPGVWGGYEVNLVIGEIAYRMGTSEGIRTPHADCIVHIHDGEITVETV